MSKPPRHKIAQRMRICDTGPDVFDNDRAVREVDDLDPDEAEEHPLIAYRRGLNRFDLDAPGTVVEWKDDDEFGKPVLVEKERTAREYLLVEDPPTFICRRLSVPEIVTCLQRGEEAGAYWAFQMATVGVENVPGLTLELGRKKDSLTDGQVEAVHDAMGYDAIIRIGNMVLRGSKQPSRAEGKPSGSSPGAK